MGVGGVGVGGGSGVGGVGGDRGVRGVVGGVDTELNTCAFVPGHSQCMYQIGSCACAKSPSKQPWPNTCVQGSNTKAHRDSDPP